ncbi:unnamed protein product [Phytophthora fragariaefolia]|uniref:Unnamed protein product n=1 Tax=Phytophthora fragariaefolia TaxID=1490495 RepID=A0A9W6XSL3_9STRA|nr:unnamed protein product [Phytophthora fragariaefolia]
MAYRVYDMEAGKVVISRDVTFNKSSFDGPKTVDDGDFDAVTDSFDSMHVCEESGPRVSKQVGKRKSPPEHKDRDDVRRPHDIQQLI